jgi:hypothetical protein
LRSQDAGGFYFWVMIQFFLGTLCAALSVGILVLLRSKRTRVSLAAYFASYSRARFPSGLTPLWIALGGVLVLFLLYAAYQTWLAPE